MNNREIADRLEQVADLLEFKNANPFRVRAYRNGARKISNLQEPLAALVPIDSLVADLPSSQGPSRLTQVEGIGKDLAQKIETLLTTGSFPLLDELKQEVPASLLLLLRIPGLGPKKAATLHRELKIDSLEGLREACQQHELQSLSGFGAKTEQTILKGIDLVERNLARTRWVDAQEIVSCLLEHMRPVQGDRQMEIAGSFRRGCETVGDLDLLVEAPNNEEDIARAMDRLGAFDQVQETLARGNTKMSVRLLCGMQVDLRVVPSQSFGAAWQYFTGSQAHNVALRHRAKKRGLKINEWGVFRVSDTPAVDDGEGTGATANLPEQELASRPIAGQTEAQTYEAVGLPWIPPELREDRGEFQAADSHALPNLITLADLQADLHMHTTATDGKATLIEMVEAARSRGCGYLAITDHSQRVAMARGLDAHRLRDQWKEIDQLNQQIPDLMILKGIECDILEPGGMDLPDDVLAEADWVIASIHYGQQQSRQQITERILGALENPHVHLLAHPTGRILGRRDPYAVDMEQVFAAAARYHKMLELNANPARLDLNDLHCAAAKRHGVPIVINTDAHSTQGLDVMCHGVQQARRGGLTPADVANCLSWNEFRKLLTRD